MPRWQPRKIGQDMKMKIIAYGNMDNEKYLIWRDSPGLWIQRTQQDIGKHVAIYKGIWLRRMNSMNEQYQAV